MTLDAIMARANAERPIRASDVFLRGGRHPVVRVDGALHETDWGVLVASEIEAMCEALLTDEAQADLRQRRSVTVSFDLPEAGPVRLAAFYARGQLQCVARALPRACPTLEQLGLPGALADIAGLPFGLVLVTGPACSGKTTTLWAMLEHINATRFAHILSLQHPIEMVIEEKRALVTIREIGTDAPSFAEAARAAFLGQDPDIVHIGEIPDLDTLGLALALAETGHMVFTQTHTATAAETVQRLVAVHPPAQQEQVRRQLAGVLRAVISQQLVPRADGNGRVPVVEIMLVVPEIAHLIAEGRYGEIEAEIEKHRGEDGMALMVQALREHVERGVITQRAAASVKLGTGQMAEG